MAYVKDWVATKLLPVNQAPPPTLLEYEDVAPLFEVRFPDVDINGRIITY